MTGLHGIRLLRRAADFLADHDDVKGARPMDALDPVELDVAGRRRTADPGLRTVRVEQRNSIGNA